MVIAVDFDGTICHETEFPDFGGFIPGAVETLKALAAKGHELSLWTCRVGENAQRAYQYCLDAGIPFKYLNEGPWEGEMHQYKKLFADVYIDNRNFGIDSKRPFDWKIIANNLLGEDDAEILWKGKYIQVISPRAAPYEAVRNLPSGKCVMVFLADAVNKMAYIRREHCPPYEYGTGHKYWYTPITGGVEKDESPAQAAVREVKEEAGIDLEKEQASFYPLYSGKFIKTLTDTISVYLIIVNSPVIEKPKGDGTKYEKESSTIAVPYNEVELLKPCDFLLKALWAMVKPYL